MTINQASNDEFRVFKLLLILATAATAVAVIALVWFNLADPAEGTTLYDTLGPLAAFSGIAAGLLFAAAAIWAAVKGLWGDVPTWVRVGVWVVILALAVFGAVSGGRS